MRRYLTFFTIRMNATVHTYMYIEVYMTSLEFRFVDNYVASIYIIHITNEQKGKKYFTVLIPIRGNNDVDLVFRARESATKFG